MIFHQPSNSRLNFNFNTAFYTGEIWNYHFHTNLELIYVIEGEVECTVNGRSCGLRSGDFGICLPCDLHKYEPRENTLYWVMVFSEDYVRYFTKQTQGKKAEGFAFRVSKEIEEYFKARLVYNEAPSVFTIKSCLYGICDEFLSQVPLSEKERNNLEPLIQITDYILENHAKKITLADAAKRFGYDYTYMSRFFRKSFNMTFGEFVLVYRLETATRLLDDTKKSITEVALESGFQSVRNFNRAFRKKMKISPSEYRRSTLFYRNPNHR